MPLSSFHRGEEQDKEAMKSEVLRIPFWSTHPEKVSGQASWLPWEGQRAQVTDYALI